MSQDRQTPYSEKARFAEAFKLLPTRMDTPEARMMLLAIGLQESRFVFRRQKGNGPARGFWQFEQGGGVRGVLRHSSTRDYAVQICEQRGVVPLESTAYTALEHDDVLACCFARLLLWTDPKPLPAIGQHEQAWTLYMRTWRPGKPHHHTWQGLYLAAMGEVL